jgi:3-isopropylmalate dehydratase small subunit
MWVPFRKLNAADILVAKQEARDNYTAGDKIERAHWHAVYVAECDAINAERYARIFKPVGGA